ncbi:MAG: hypothetical protein Q7U09_19690 [Hydrogenophaga sp.]|uniref:hypothetical protein n=1 Tax=Hydrogenophaga taeniospiralis TaxID=65656 RepID=UPI001CF996BF|nr:hypothetical protein [Hydrogenophaga taeniospiralis]MDO9293806.1 hypothetical protein [Hydrogenophaga sp.]UCU95752.1 hypothetical protein KI616_07905 [Hydrogenophaga taeniospiralis]
MSQPMLHSALLGLIQGACESVLILVEQLPREELMRSRLTRAEVQRQLATLAASVAQIEPEQRATMPELDWSGWALMRVQLAGPPSETLDEALWFASQSLVPATLLWLRVYRQSQPDLFRMSLA